MNVTMQICVVGSEKLHPIPMGTTVKENSQAQVKWKWNSELSEIQIEMKLKVKLKKWLALAGR